MTKLGYAVLAEKMFVEAQNAAKGLIEKIGEIYCYDNISDAWLDRPLFGEYRGNNMILVMVRYSDERKGVIYKSAQFGGDIVWVEAIQEIQFLAYVTRIQ